MVKNEEEEKKASLACGPSKNRQWAQRGPRATVCGSVLYSLNQYSLIPKTPWVYMLPPTPLSPLSFHTFSPPGQKLRNSANLGLPSGLTLPARVTGDLGILVLSCQAVKLLECRGRVTHLCQFCRGMKINSLSSLPLPSYLPLPTRDPQTPNENRDRIVSPPWALQAETRTAAFQGALNPCT